MPPDARLDDAELAVLEEWVGRGAPDSRATTAAESWERAYAERLRWWSLQPLGGADPPQVAATDWPATPVDAFVLAGLEQRGLRPSAEADPETLARRLALVLTGLPPAAETVRGYAANPTPAAYAQLVEDYLASPHFGEHWARHWMDVVHYSDTHGYEWDIPAKHAWRYRDYLVRAFNADVPFKQLVLEHVAGDRIAPRIDPATGCNEALCGPMGLQLGERRHGDNADAEGVSQEAAANVIDTVTKAFLGTTVACAQCHDHKLDAIAQSDYYALAGVFASSRWTVRCTDATGLPVAAFARLAELKRGIRARLASRWLGSRDGLAAALAAETGDEGRAGEFPETIAAVLRRSATRPIALAEFTAERDRRIRHNRENLALLADFATEHAAEQGWRWEGRGMETGLVAEGEVAVADDGDRAVAHLLPAGRWSHAWSMRLAGAVRSPELYRAEPLTFSMGYGGGCKAARGLIVDRALHSERQQWDDVAPAAWVAFTAGRFPRLAGPPDTAPRRVYFEAVTKALNGNFPPRTGLGGVGAEDEADPRSWFGVTRAYAHPPGCGPVDELAALAPLFVGEGAPTAAAGRRELVDRATSAVIAAVARWERGDCQPSDTATINEALREGWLSGNLGDDAPLAELVRAYRAAARELPSESTVGSLDDWHEGADEPVAVRGDYHRPGALVPRGTVRFLAGRADPTPAGESGRLEFARSLVDDANPLTARVFVNRAWMHAFGEGLVRTPDDFGRLGAPPDHPQLLDYLARRFQADGWSTKKLLRLLVSSAAWRQSSAPHPASEAIDPTNSAWHRYPRRPLEAEALRDSMLAVAGRLDRTLGGPPVDPYRVRADAAKRLAIGPIDGLGRRSLYLKVTLMEPPRLLALFNQPLPRVAMGKRDRTEVPEQALALLNDPFMAAVAGEWAARAVEDGSATVEQRCASMFSQAVCRRPEAAETQRLAAFARRFAALRGTPEQHLLAEPAAWRDVAHALFNLQEFRHVY